MAFFWKWSMWADHSIHHPLIPDGGCHGLSCSQLLPAAPSYCSFDFAGATLKSRTEINSFSLQVLMYRAILITATGRKTKRAEFLHLLVRFCTSHKQRHWWAVQLFFLKCTAKAPEDWANVSCRWRAGTSTAPYESSRVSELRIPLLLCKQVSVPWISPFHSSGIRV